MQFEIPYRIGRLARATTPDFLVRADIGGDEILTWCSKPKAIARSMRS